MKIWVWLTSLATAFTIGYFVDHQLPPNFGSQVATQLADQAVPPIIAAETSTLPKIKGNDPLPANLFIELAKVVNPAVVNIYTTYLPKGRPFPGRERGGGPNQGDPFFDLFQQFMGPNPYEQAPSQSLGTGFIIRDDGLIITNNHVIDKGDTIKVQLTEETKENFDAKVIGKDAKTDIALIKIISKRKLPTVKLGTSADVQVGEWVGAFGNPYGHGHTMTKGIVSAINREIDELNLFPFIQTDASINPGNSGGPLVNTQGLVIGVNAAIDARAQGIGFAIPIDNVKAILPALENEGSVKRGFIGVAMTDLDDESAKSLGLKQKEGALITQVVAGSPAEGAGLEPYDLITEYDGKKVNSTRDLLKAVLISPVGKKVAIKFMREGKPKSASIAIGNTPSADKLAKMEQKTEEDGGTGVIAPFEIGFRVADYSVGLAKEYGLPLIKPGHPIVTEVERNSPAGASGIRPGDIILDVNRKDVSKARDVVKALKKSGNLLRVLKQDRVVLISIR
jgi:serine protease Do